MGISSSQLQPEELSTFKKIPGDALLKNINIPEKPENRRPTNVKWLVILGIFILLLVPFFIYTLCYSDITRILVGYDKCGNTCGKKNYKWDGISCSGKDMTNTPFLEYENYQGGLVLESELNNYRARHCVQSCQPGYIEVFGRCYKGSSGGFGYDSSSEYSSSSYGVQSNRVREQVDLSAYFSNVKWQIIISCLVSILVAMGMLFLFRYAMAFVVWGILLGCFLGVLVLVGTFWYGYVEMSNANRKSGEDATQIMLFFGIVFTAFAVFLAIILVWCRKKIQLVILLLKEATKAVFDMPCLISVPAACVVAILLLTSFFILTTTYMASAGILQKDKADFYTYVPNTVMLFTIVYNVLAYLWLSQFFIGIQYMIIAGAVSKWYFSREKQFLGSPILHSVFITFKYHLGSVALGALVITLIQVIKSIILSLLKNKTIRCFVESAIKSVERFFKFLSKNSYIITAMHGQAFLRSGKRAAKLIIQNLSDIVAVNYVGDFILGMTQMLVVIISVLLSMGLFAMTPEPSLHATETSNLPAYIVVAIFSLLVATFFFGVFETTIDTLFVCYCEDKVLNDGMEKPYFMSRNLMEFIEESKDACKK